MAKKSKKKAATSKKAARATAGRKDWSKDDMKTMKTLIKQNTPTRLIAMKLKRSEGSVRSKASYEGLSLRPTNRSPRD
jgi:hypothetical protein